MHIHCRHSVQFVILGQSIIGAHGANEMWEASNFLLPPISSFTLGK